MRELSRRLIRLEEAYAPRSTFTRGVRVIQEVGETAEGAIARTFPEGVPTGVLLTIRKIIAARPDCGGQSRKDAWAPMNAERGKMARRVVGAALCLPSGPPSL